ncbi:MAG: hypothetical protein Q4Q22_06855 [Methanosphaera sp.]|nr:hypothetical protein [Methanosphaera sp.]
MHAKEERDELYSKEYVILEECIMESDKINYSISKVNVWIPMTYS